MQQPQHGRVQRRVEIAERFVVAVGGEQVLDQVVGADREEVDRADEAGQRDRRGGHFDHRAERDVVGDLVAFAAQVARALASAARAHRDDFLARMLTIGTSTRTGP